MVTFQRKLNRLPVRLGPEYYQTYHMASPLRTHWRPATCEEYECPQFIEGFILTVDVSTALGQNQYDYVTHDKSRSFSVQRISMSAFKFIYPPGNSGFGEGHRHKLLVGREPLYVVTGGDWRGNPRGTPQRRHTRPEFWIEDCALNQSKIAEIIQKG